MKRWRFGFAVYVGVYVATTFGVYSDKLSVPNVIQDVSANEVGVYSEPVTTYSYDEPIELEKSNDDILVGMSMTPMVEEYNSLGGCTVYVTEDTAIRSQSSVDSEFLKFLIHGDAVVVEYDLGSGWYKVNKDGVSGYVNADFISTTPPYMKIYSTAYYDAYNQDSASGRPLYAGHSVAGMEEWLGRSVNVYGVNADGSVGEFLGTYTFDDTGYGRSTGYGVSKVLDGVNIGTIENGTCIDIYMDTRDECMDYGERDIYIQFIY